ncbi:MAG: DUF418 domain-containing protein [Myxococcota bacterium]
MHQGSLPPPGAAPERIVGFDVARALAVLGMVMVNYKGQLDSAERGPDWLVWLNERIEGRSAALFVVLAGIGLSLRSRRARIDPATHLAFERSALLRRAVVLYGAGLLNLHLWEWDILHFYGLFLAVAAGLLTAPGLELAIVGLACIVGSVALQASFPYEVEAIDIWSPTGALSDLFFNGLHPFFPWMAFVVLGMWLGRLPLGESATRRRLVTAAIPVLLISEGLDTWATRFHESLPIDPEHVYWLSTWPRAPRPLYVLAAGAMATLLICGCIEVTKNRGQDRWVLALSATGQLAFSLYILHAIAILIPLEHELLDHSSLAETMAYSFAFYAGAVALSLWWRRRFLHGPLETLIRQIAGRTSPGHPRDLATK